MPGFFQKMNVFTNKVNRDADLLTTTDLEGAEGEHLLEGPEMAEEYAVGRMKKINYKQWIPGAIGGIVIAGYGIWKGIVAKRHIDEVMKKIKYAQN